MPVNSNHVCCSWQCGRAHTQYLELKLLAEKEKREKEILKIRVGIYKKLLQDDIQEIARLIDFGLTCLARGLGGQIHGGHIWSKGAHSNIKLNIHNVHRQCSHSNHWQNDDALLREGLKNEYGESYYDFVEALKATPIMKYSNDQYAEFRKKARGIIRRLKKDLRIRSVSERIELRNSINLELGIYPESFCIYNQIKRKTA